MSLLIDALEQKNITRPPIWLYRQAGRYMPEYQAIKKNRPLHALFSERELIVEITQLPMKLLDVDAAILFADILTLLEGFSIPWQVVEGVGPVLEPVKDVAKLEKKEAKDVYGHIENAIIDLKKILKVPLIGFGGGPFTVATYLVEGKVSKELKGVKQWIYNNGVQFHALLEKVTDATIDYLNLQIEAGVDVIQLFDSWAGLLNPSAFQEFSLKYLNKVMKGLKRKIPIILFCRGSCSYASALDSLNPTAIGFDWQGDLDQLSHQVKASMQGNLDPMVLFGTKENIKREVDSLLQKMRGSRRFIFNLGHGILPDTPFSNVRYLVDYVKI